MSILVSADAIPSTHDIEILPTQPEFRADPTSHITDTLSESLKKSLKSSKIFKQSLNHKKRRNALADTQFHP